MFIIAAPTVATMTSYTLMQFVDKLIVSRITPPDPIYVGAQGNGGLVCWVFVSMMMGMITVINTFVSQNLGAGRTDRAPAYAWNGLWMSVLYWLVVMIPFGLVLPHVFEMMRAADLTPDALAQVVRRDGLATSYGRILIYGSVVTMASRAIAQYFYGMHRPMVVLIASVVGNVVNFVFNCLLVFGPTTPHPTGSVWLDDWFAHTASLAQRWGWAAHGIDGSGYATVIGTFVEFLIPMFVFLSPKFVRAYGTMAQWKPSLPHMRDLFKIGWPGALMFGNEMICWAFFMVYLVGDFGPMHSTAGWIAHQWMTLSFMPAVGLSIAITATVGKCIGMGRMDLATQRVWLGLKLAVAYMTFCGLVFLIFRRHLVGMFVDAGTSPADRELIISVGSKFLIATAAFQFFDGIAMSMSGALRGAGDTRFPGIVTLLLSWTIIVGGGLALVHFAPQLQSLGPWIAAATYIIILALVLLARFLGGHWKKIKLLDHSAGSEPGAGLPAPAAVEPEAVLAAASGGGSGSV
jgi:MATE family multidrug resistance protein